MPIPLYTGTVPNPAQSQPEFDTNTQEFIDYIAEIAPEINATVEALNFNSTSSNSTTSVLIGTGTKNFTVDTGKSYLPGMTVKIARTSAPTNWMVGEVVTYNSGTGALVTSISKIQGSGTFTDWTITLAATEQLDDEFVNDQTNVAVASDDSFLISHTSDSNKNKKSLISSLLTLIFGDVRRAVPVRQTVLSGPVTTAGLPDFGGATGANTLTMAGTLEVTAANGTSNRTGSGTNLQWTGLSTNGTMYLYVDIGVDGTLTTGAGTLAPSYRQGGADIVTNGQFTFNIQEMVGKVGNGSSAVQKYRVYVGQVTVAGGVVTAIVWYALMGRFTAPWTSTLPGTSTTITANHNLGIPNIASSEQIKPKGKLELECITAEYGYAIGDTFTDPASGYTGGTLPIKPVIQGNLIYVTTGAGTAFNGNSNGTAVALTAARWKYRFIVERGW